MRLLVQRPTTSDATSMALASLLGPTWTGARRSQIPDVLADRPRPSCHLRSLILYAPGNGTAPLLLYSLPVGKLATTLNSAPALAPGRAPAACAPSTPPPPQVPRRSTCGWSATGNSGRNARASSGPSSCGALPAVPGTGLATI